MTEKELLNSGTEAEVFEYIFKSFCKFMQQNQFPSAFIEDAAQDLARYIYKHVIKFRDNFISLEGYLRVYYYKNRKALLKRYYRPSIGVVSDSTVEDFNTRFAVDLDTEAIHLYDSILEIKRVKFSKRIAGIPEIRDQAIAYLTSIVLGNQTDENRYAPAARILARRSFLKTVDYRYSLELEFR